MVKKRSQGKSSIKKNKNLILIYYLFIRLTAILLNICALYFSIGKSGTQSFIDPSPKAKISPIPDANSP